MFSFLLRIWALASPYRVRLFLGVFAGILAGAFQPLTIAIAVIVYGLVFPSADSPLSEQLKKYGHLPDFLLNWLNNVQDALVTGIKAHPSAIVALVLLIPGVFFLRGLFSYLNIYFLQWVAIRTITDLRVRLFAHLMNLSAVFFNRSNTGDLISRMTNDTSALQSVLSNATAVIVKDPATLLTTFIWLLWTDWRLTLVSLVILPVCIIPIAVYGRKVRRSAGNVQTHFAELTGVMSESFTGNRIIKAYNLENVVVQRFRSTAGKMVSNYMRIVRSMETPGPLTETFGALGVALMILYLVTRSGGKANPTHFISLAGGILTMYSPIKNLARLHNNLEQARAASARVFELLAASSAIPEPAHPIPLKAAGAEITFDHVSFNYDTRQALNDVNLTVKPGQLVALVGKSGSGKTTLTNLLLRFYDPLTGCVRIGGTDIRQATTLDLRHQIAVVTQETLLFDETIRRNIELGRLGATEAEIIAAAKHAHAHEFIMEKPNGYDTLVGEKGVMLSGGQKQRLAIARAILKDAPILILDEATNALDPESEHIVQSALEELMKSRTTIYIAHKLSTATVQKANAIVVMEQGRIVEIGRHEELWALNGVYRRLYELQFQS